MTNDSQLTCFSRAGKNVGFYRKIVRFLFFFKFCRALLGVAYLRCRQLLEIPPQH